MDSNQRAFGATFRRTLLRARRLVRSSLPNHDAGLRSVMAFVLNNQAPSGYPFVLKYAFCRQERDENRILPIAAAVHLLQQSSFLTDDIFDCGELRCGKPPVYLKYGVNQAIIAAQLLQAIAFRCVGDELARGHFHHGAVALNLLHQILLDGYVGQYLDIVQSGRPSVTPREYCRVIALGAGRAMQNVARCGALLAGKPEREVRALSRFARAYGMALFIIDDITDILPARQTGKTYASDLKGRRMRLPLIMALRLANRGQRELLRRFLSANRARRPGIEQVAAVILGCGACQASQRVARYYLRSSLSSLSKLEPGITAERFRWLAGRLLKLVEPGA